MRVTVHWHAGEWPPMPDGISFCRKIEIYNTVNRSTRNCEIGKITMKPGVVPAHYRKLRDKALEQLAKGRT